MKYIILALTLALHCFANAQTIKIDAEIRPRAEYKNYLNSPDFDPIFVVTQRSRLNFFVENKKQRIRSKFSIADTRPWGNASQQATTDEQTFSIAEAWAELLFTEEWTLKLGRQPIGYDDERIFGFSNFSQQARWHDAAVLKYEGYFKLHIGGSYSTQARKSPSYDMPYNLYNYKNMQYLHFQKKTKTYNISLLFLNNGLEYTSDTESATTIYNQTTGTYLYWKPNTNLKLETMAYLQTGRDHANRHLFAYNAKASLEYWWQTKRFATKVGVDILSGNAMDIADDTNNSFTTLYGASLLHLGMAGIYLVPYSASQNTYNTGLVNYSVELKFLYKKWYLWNKFFVYQSQNEFANTQGNTQDNIMGKSLGFENETFIIYRYNKNITLQAIVGLFNMSDNTKALAHPQLGNYANFEDWQRWFILEISIRPSIFVKSWDK